MFGLGPWELIFVLILVIFFFGGKKLAQLGDGLGRSITAFKKAVRSYPDSDSEIGKPSSKGKDELEHH